jgi:branched-chain amino acid aminotransferase group I
MAEVVFLNGKFLLPKEAKLSILEPGFLYGWGLFETMRSYQNRIIYFDAHLERIKSSAKFCGLQLSHSRAKLKEIIKKAVRKSGFKDAYVRLTLWKSLQPTGISVIVKKYKPYSIQRYKKGINLTVSCFTQNENSFFARIKTTSRLLYELSYAEAKKKGFAGSLILNNRGYITEGSRSNIFFVKDNAVFTPSLACGCLDGITRRVIFNLAKKSNIKVYEGNFTLEDLHQAEEIFLTNSLSGVMPVVSINRKVIGSGRCGKVTKFFIEKYNSLLR